MSGTTKGSELLLEGERLLQVALRTVDTRSASDAINEAVRVLRSAMNWLEDTDGFEIAHETLDRAGHLRRSLFPELCVLPLSDQGYAMTCPVSLAHNRVGLSPGYIVRSSECSVCRRDPEDCMHVLGREYGGAVCYRIITRAEVIEVSLVGRPANPDARIESIGVSDADLRKRLGPQFERGMRVRCDRCMTPCDGVERPFEGSSHGVPMTPKRDLGDKSDPASSFSNQP